MLDELYSTEATIFDAEEWFDQNLFHEMLPQIHMPYRGRPTAKFEGAMITVFSTSKMFNKVVPYPGQDPQINSKST